MKVIEKIILIADDDLDDQELLEEVILEIDTDAIIHTVSSGKETLEFLRNCKIDALPTLIILDYNMPDQTGAQVTEAISKDNLYGEIPILVWSTSNSAVYKSECIGKGAKEYFFKPHEFTEVKQMARQMLSYCTEDRLKSV